jgi:Kef-type K+ transport system membrane component KefB
MALASSRYRFHVFSELRPFRDFFLALFFVYLGGQVVFDGIGGVFIPLLILSLFVLIGNPLIVLVLMMKLGYKAKDSFMTGLTVAQISEFSFIVVALALNA